MPLIPLRDGQSLHIRVLGRGRPVLMLPGLGMSSAHWLPFVLPYLHRFRFYLPDLRGFGRSARVRLNQADIFHNHMQDVQDLIAHYGLRDFCLAGISLGGSTALHLLREGGFDGVRRYLHIDQSPSVANREDWPYGLFGPRQDEMFGKLRHIHALLQAREGADYLGELPGPLRRQAATTLAELFTLMGGRPGLEPVLRTVLALPGGASRLLPLSRLDDALLYMAAYSNGGHDYRAALRACPVPITVMVGMRSPLYAPAGQMAIAEYAPQARIVRFEKSGHVPLTDEPVKFTRELGRFLYGP